MQVYSNDTFGVLLSSLAASKNVSHLKLHILATIFEGIVCTFVFAGIRSILFHGGYADSDGGRLLGL